MKKLLSFILSITMFLTIATPVNATETLISKEEIPTATMIEETGKFSIALIGEEITPKGRVEVYTFEVPGDGRYYQIPDFYAEYNHGTTITVYGAWEPSFADLTIRFKETSNNSSAEFTVACGEQRSVILWKSAYWNLSVCAKDHSIFGTIRVEVS